MVSATTNKSAGGACPPPPPPINQQEGLGPLLSCVTGGPLSPEKQVVNQKEMRGGDILAHSTVILTEFLNSVLLRMFIFCVIIITNICYHKCTHIIWPPNVRYLPTPLYTPL